MESGGMVFDSYKMTSVLLKNEKLPCSSDDSQWIPSSSPSFHGSTPVLNFEDVRGENSTDKPFFDKKENDSKDFDGCLRKLEKKRRLFPDQARFLEKSFKVENKLEPERKIQLAKEIGLQPRQVAIWYQNRRARYKTKQLEEDYDSLKATYDKLKADHDSLFKETEKLRIEVDLLKDELLQRERGKPKSEPCDPTRSPLKAGSDQNKLLPSCVSPKPSNIPMVICKQEDATCAKTDVFDSDSPHYANGTRSSFLEPSDSSHIFDSEFSQDEINNLSRSLMFQPCFARLEDECDDDLQLNSSNLRFPVEYQATWLWPVIE